MTRDPLDPRSALSPAERESARANRTAWDDLSARVLLLIDRGELDAEGVLSVCERLRVERSGVLSVERGAP